MHCNQEQIEALLDGELTGPEGDAVLAHLRDCPGCRSYYRQLLAMEQALRADTDPVPEDLLADIMSRVHDTPQRRRRQLDGSRDATVQNRICDALHLPELWMGVFENHLSGSGLRMIQHVERGVDGRAGNAKFTQ